MSKFNIVLSDEKATVVSEFKANRVDETKYQSEENLEQDFIKQLISQGYEYLSINSADQLKDNLRKQLEKLNKITFTDNEWTRFSKEHIYNEKLSVKEKADTIQIHHQKNLIRDNGSSINIYFIDKNNIHNNKVQVINQYVNNEGKYKTRYDVTILVNGLPLVHIELKRRGVDLKHAFNQIERYQMYSFWKDTGLFEFVQIFVISNGTNTKYYSNTTRWNTTDGRDKNRREKTSNSFEFTSFWADAKNKHINDLRDFTVSFFNKDRLLKILTRYCVLTVDSNLLVMRPYQIAATERIINRIECAHQYKTFGSIEAGGFIWHTTGSGKTLTSFKTAQLATKLDFIDKVLFVVDRKDLDYQTMREYDRFEKGAANSNKSTAILERQLNDPKCKIIITTIQKLSNFIKQHKKHDVYGKEIVMIFDECHRSQFGEMHQAIINSFKKYYIFGFTGTPITAPNAKGGIKAVNKTTSQTFGDKLHTYTIDNAINDNNVLRFKVSYLSTMKSKKHIDDEAIYDIDRLNALLWPLRIMNNAKYIYDNFDRLTYRKSTPYAFNVLQNIAEVSSARGKRTNEIKRLEFINGFNAILATASIEMAKRYYQAFKTINAKHNEVKDKLKVGLIYSYGVNDEDMTNGFMTDENSDDTNGLDKNDRDFLELAIKDYNKMFGCNFDTSAGHFSDYYKDISLRMKNKQLDLLIVVNMFLTGFDATTLNTLFVDKKLRQHGLIQAFSRTNRILNSVKSFGNIVCFANIKHLVQEAISLFADKDANALIELLPYDSYYFGYEKDGKHVDGYLDMIHHIRTLYPLDKDIIGEKAEKKFISLFGGILKMRNVLVAFDEFKDNQDMPDREVQDYQSIYLDLKDKYSRIGEQKQLTNINEDIVFETELIDQEDYGVDYILAKVAEFHVQHMKDKDIRVAIQRMIDASPTLRSKKELIETFLANVIDIDDAVARMKQWNAHATEEYNKELDTLIEEYNLNPIQTKQFIKDCFEDGEIKTSGTDITKVLPPINFFDKTNKRETIKEKVLNRIKEIYVKYYNALISL